MNSHQVNNSKRNILIVDDTLEELRLLSAVLTERGYKVRHAINGSMALIGAKAAPPELILLDIKLPDLSGYEVCKQLKADSTTCFIPVIFLSALDEVIDKVNAFAVGGVDYITKPFQIEEVLARVETHLELQAAKLEIRQLNTELESRVRERTEQLEAANRELEKEIAFRQRAESELRNQTLHDGLTGLANRALLMDRLELVIKRSQRKKDKIFAVLFLDLNRFKMINDSFGHLVGDQLLMAVALRLKKCQRAEDTVARLGGDEFVILLEELTNIDDAIKVAERICQELKPPIILDESEVFVTASIGIAVGGSQTSYTNYEKAAHLLRDADTAMYRAKARGQGTYEVFNSSMHSQVLKQLQLENELRRAIERQELLVHYQPIISLATNQIQGFEALVRWQHPVRGLIFPAEFILIAEETGVIETIDQWVLREACRQLRLWQEQFPSLSPLSMSVNLSSKQFSQSGLISFVEQVLQSNGLDGNALKLEITENGLIENFEEAATMLKQLRKRRVQLSLDDFGTGYSSLSYLHRFPFNTLKIDRSFVKLLGAEKAPCECEIVKAIVNLGSNLGMSVIAEGVETAEQLAQLQALNCHFGQGNWFSQPRDSLGITDWITSAFEQAGDG